MHAISNTPTTADRRAELEELFVANLPLITRILEAKARRQRFSPDAVEEFTAWAIARMITGDYAVLAKFRGESALSTYLTKVADSQLREYRHITLGRWRPSASAGRLGAIGLQVERLTVRDGMTLQQAAEQLRTSGATTLSDRDLARIAATLPRRHHLRPVEYSTDAVSRSSAPCDDCDTFDADEILEQQRRLRLALASIGSEELELIRLLFWNGLSIADVSRMLGLRQKPMYRRVNNILKSLRQRMQADDYQSVC